MLSSLPPFPFPAACPPSGAERGRPWLVGEALRLVAGHLPRNVSATSDYQKRLGVGQAGTGGTEGDTEGDTVGDTVGDTWFASRLFFSRGDAGNLSSRRAFVPGAPCPNLGNARLFCALSHGRLPSHSSLLSCAGSAGATACAPCSETIHWDWTRPVSNIGPWKSKELISSPRVHLRNYRTQCVGDHASFKTCVAIRPGQ